MHRLDIRVFVRSHRGDAQHVGSTGGAQRNPGYDDDALSRTRKAVAIIKQHPFWYAGTVVNRMAAVMKYAGAPSGIYGSAGINVTSRKCLAIQWQGGIVAVFVNGLGMLQSVLRYILLPLMLVGVIIAFLFDWRTTGLIMATVFYYWVVGSLMHTHIRYGLPMHALLTIFAGLACWRTKEFVVSRKLSSFPVSEARL